MAVSLIIEEDRGTFAKRERRHNGYYGGDFSTLPYIGPAGLSSTRTRPRTPTSSPTRIG